MHSQRLIPILYLIIVGIGAILLSSFGWKGFWSSLHIPTMSPCFADMRTVQGGLESIQSGHNPQLINPGDPWGRTMNYPLVWLNIARLMKLDDEVHFLIFCSGLVLSLVMVSAYMLFMFPSGFLLCSILSSATLLAIERGNNDILAFLLLFAFAYSGRSFLNIALLAAVLLKLYPIFAMHSVLAKREYCRLLVLLVGISCVLAFIYCEIPAIRSGNTANGTLSYGISSIKTVTKMIMHLIPGGTPLHYVAVTGILFATFCYLLKSFFLKPFMADVTNHGTRSSLFLIGAAIFVYTFILAANWDYRLIFLILCIPYLSLPEHGWQGKALCVMILFAMNEIWLRWIWAPLAYLSVFSKMFLFGVLCLVISKPLIDTGFSFTRYCVVMYTNYRNAKDD